jgi:hypothetical protein
MSRLAILQELLARVQDISVVNGYTTDAGLTVFCGETPSLGPDDPLAAIAVVVRKDMVSDQGPDELRTLPIEIQALAKADLNQPQLTVEAVIEDILRAIEATDLTLGGLLTRDLAPGPITPYQRAEGSTTVGCGIEYRAMYLRRRGS